MVVHSQDGMDEVSLAAATDVAELKNGAITEYSIQPEDYGIQRQSVETLVVADAQESLALIKQALTGQPGPAADILALNAGAAIYVAGQAPDMQQGVAQAQQIMQSGQAWQLIQDLAQYTQQLQ